MLLSAPLIAHGVWAVIEGFGQSACSEDRAATAAPEPDELTFTAPTQLVAPWLTGFAYRHDSHCGDVVYELPELRPTIQIMLADDYYLRERDDADSWRPVPRIALWGPRVTWGYGYARKHVRAFGIGLSPRGFAELIARPIAPYIDRVVDLADVHPRLAAALKQIVARGSAPDWIAAVSDLVLQFVNASSAAPHPLDRSLALLLEGEGDAVRRAAEAAGLGERQYRRHFQMRYGFSPRLYRRVLRVDRLMRRLHPAPWERDPHPMELEFADQAHMIREFKALTGVTPGEYVRRKRTRADATIRSVVAQGIAPPLL